MRSGGGDSSRRGNRPIRKGETRTTLDEGPGSEAMMASIPKSTVKRLEPAPSTTATASANEELDALRRQIVAIQRVSSLGVLAGSICHELNNALTPILNYAKLGLRNPDPEYRRRAFEKILEAAQRASAITGGVLGLARPRADRHKPTDMVRLFAKVRPPRNQNPRPHPVPALSHPDASPL